MPRAHLTIARATIQIFRATQSKRNRFLIRNPGLYTSKGSQESLHGTAVRMRGPEAPAARTLRTFSPVSRHTRQHPSPRSVASRSRVTTDR
eukprot:5623284-Pyramimonas_sp.AAC.2